MKYLFIIGLLFSSATVLAQYGTISDNLCIKYVPNVPPRMDAYRNVFFLYNETRTGLQYWLTQQQAEFTATKCNCDGMLKASGLTLVNMPNGMYYGTHCSTCERMGYTNICQIYYQSKLMGQERYERLMKKLNN